MGDEEIEKTKGYLGCATAIILSPILIPVGFAYAFYSDSRENPKIRTSPIIPRITRAGKIKFLEWQLRRVDTAICLKLEHCSKFADLVYYNGGNVDRYTANTTAPLVAKRTEIKSLLDKLYAMNC